MKFPPASDIRRMRKAMDITQAELANQSGISQSTIAKIERGRIQASYASVVKLFETLDDMAKGGRRDVTAADVASGDIVTVQSTDKVRIASELMRATGFSQLPVLKGDTPVGSISERSIFNMIRGGKTMEDLKDTPVSTIMEESFPLVSENTPISSITAVMSDYPAILVARKGRLTGMITKADILKLI